MITSGVFEMPFGNPFSYNGYDVEAATAVVFVAVI
jgi:hypothetical protein